MFDRDPQASESSSDVSNPQQLTVQFLRVTQAIYHLRLLFVYAVLRARVAGASIVGVNAML